MIKSMTGFGKSTTDTEIARIDVEIKSLNSKSIDIRVKSNLALGSAEIDLQNIISQQLQRGKVECNILISPKKISSASSINPDIFDFYYQQLKSLSNKYNRNFDNENIFENILKLPKVVEMKELDVESFLPLIEQAMNEAIINLDSFRIQEGKSIEKDLLNSLSVIKQSLAKVPDFETERIQNIQQKIVSAFNELALTLDPQRLAAEMIYYLEKFDINEEKTRLGNHNDYFGQTFAEDNCGRKLGFITQEMGREINTLGSKANHFEIQKLVVVMKDNLEKMKEQVLNIL